MGEIKSTLELVMERTRGMAISEEERKEMKKRKSWRRRWAFPTATERARSH